MRTVGRVSAWLVAAVVLVLFAVWALQRYLIYLPGRGPVPPASTVSPGARDVTLRTSWDDWLDVAGGRVNPGHAVMRGRLKPRARLVARELLADAVAKDVPRG